MNDTINFDDIDVAAIGVEGIEVVTVSDALALPETGASSGSSGCGSCSTCGSSSCCGSCGGSKAAESAE
ncbi:thiazolylpeptide-type bacteriocin [Chitinimonas sp.]|uniref:thiazolylpeptide-type bacteriocin n=1 Tax=Chitinimonas sp. TaxID=1934313 RepID=UPI0035B4EB27